MPDATVPIRRRMASAVGPVRRDLRLAFQLVADHVGVQIEKGHLLEFVPLGILEQPRQRTAGNCAPTEACDDGVAIEHDARQRLAHAIGDNAAQTYRQALFKHDDALRVLQRLT